MKNLLHSGLLLTFLLIGASGNLFSFTAVTSGAWSSAATWGGVAPGSTVSGQDIIIPAGLSVTLDMDVTFSGILNVCNIEGSLVGTSGNRLTISSGSLSGSGTIDIHRLEFGGLATSSFSGDLMLGILENNSTLLTLAAVTTISDTLSLEGGSLTLGSGANLEILADAWIRRNDGTIVTGGGILNTGNNYHVVYTGGSKTTGIEINSTTLQTVAVQLDNNSQSLSLGSDLQVNTLLDLSMGELDLNGNDLELYGNMSINGGAMIASSASSNILLQSTTALTSAFEFAPGSSCDMWTIDHTGTGNIELTSHLTVLGELRMADGTLSLESGSTLAMGAGSLVHINNGAIAGNGGAFDGSLSYNVEYMGGTTTTGLEVTGSGLNDLTISLDNSDDQLQLDGNVIVNGHTEMVMGMCNLNGYDLSLEGTLDQQPDCVFMGDPGSELELGLTVTDNDTIWFDSANHTIDQLTLNLSGTGDVVLGSELNITDELNLTAGRLDISNFELVIENGAIISNYSDTRYIVTSGSGMLQLYVTTGSPYEVFPVGTATNYSPCSIAQATGGTSGYFMVNTFNGVYSNGTSGYNMANAGAMVNRTWRVETGTGFTYNMDLKLGWQAASEVNGFDRTNCYISHYMGSWDTYANGSAVMGLNNTYEVERTGITTLSPFAVSETGTGLKIEENQDITITLYPNPAGQTLVVNPGSNAGHYQYQIVDLSGRIYDIRTLGENRFDISFLESGAYVFRMIDTETGEITTTEFIKE